METLDLRSKSCAQYMQNIFVEIWASYAHRKPQYWHLTLNIQKSVSSHWLPIR